jgi:hypothetical protein
MADAQFQRLRRAALHDPGALERLLHRLRQDDPPAWFAELQAQGRIGVGAWLQIRGAGSAARRRQVREWADWSGLTRDRWRLDAGGVAMAWRIGPAEPCPNSYDLTLHFDGDDDLAHWLAANLLHSCPDGAVRWAEIRAWAQRRAELLAARKLALGRLTRAGKALARLHAGPSAARHGLHATTLVEQSNVADLTQQLADHETAKTTWGRP